MSYKLSKKEAIKEIVKCGKDSSYFINNYAKISHPLEGLISFKTYPYQDQLHVGDLIGFPHRISVESGFKEMYPLIKDKLKYKLWVTNLNNTPFDSDEMVINKILILGSTYLTQLVIDKLKTKYKLIGYVPSINPTNKGDINLPIEELLDAHNYWLEEYMNN